MKEPKPAVKVSSVEQVIDGKPYYYRLDKDGKVTELSMCCDCQLVHLLEFKPSSRGLRVRAWREDELTAKYRKKKK